MVIFKLKFQRALNFPLHCPYLPSTSSLPAQHEEALQRETNYEIGPEPGARRSRASRVVRVHLWGASSAAQPASSRGERAEGSRLRAGVPQSFARPRGRPGQVAQGAAHVPRMSRGFVLDSNIFWTCLNLTSSKLCSFLRNRCSLDN